MIWAGYLIEQRSEKKLRAGTEIERNYYYQTIISDEGFKNV